MEELVSMNYQPRLRDITLTRRKNWILTIYSVEEDVKLVRIVVDVQKIGVVITQISQIVSDESGDRDHEVFEHVEFATTNDVFQRVPARRTVPRTLPKFNDEAINEGQRHIANHLLDIPLLQQSNVHSIGGRAIEAHYLVTHLDPHPRCELRLLALKKKWSP